MKKTFFLAIFALILASCANTSTTKSSSEASPTEQIGDSAASVVEEEPANISKADNDMSIVSEPGKSAIVTLGKGDVIYVGIRNYVDINLTGYTWDDGLKVSISQGSSIADDTLRGKGHFWVQSVKPGKAEITVTQNGKKVSAKTLRVKSLPNPPVKVAKKASGKISKNELSDASGISTWYDDFEYDVNFRVAKFTVSTVIKGFSQKETSESALFTAKQKELIRQTPLGGYIFITDIKVVGPDAKERELQPIVFELQ